jgi:prevent-host-death family protein
MYKKDVTYLLYRVEETMTRAAASQVRKDFAEAINKVVYQHERIVLHRRGKDVAVLVSMEDFRILEALEDQLDIEAADRALADPRNKKRIPWDRVKAKLGL